MTDRDTLIQRLRDDSRVVRGNQLGWRILDEAADEIERLTAYIKQWAEDAADSDAKFQELEQERDRLQRERDEWKEWHASMQALRDKHSKSVDRLIAERDRLQRDYADLLAQTTDTDVENRRLRAALEAISRMHCGAPDHCVIFEEFAAGIAREALGPAQETENRSASGEANGPSTHSDGFDPRTVRPTLGPARTDPRCADGCYLYRKRVNRGLEPPMEASEALGPAQFDPTASKDHDLAAQETNNKGIGHEGSTDSVRSSVNSLRRGE